MRPFKEFIVEKTAEDDRLIKYMRSKLVTSFDDAMWEDFALWTIYDDDGKELNVKGELGKLIKRNINSDTDILNIDKNNRENIYFKLPIKIQRAFGDYIEHVWIDTDPVNAPSWVTMQAKKPLSDRAWLVHFSNKAAEIAKTGFKYGVNDVTKLGMTGWLAQSTKKHGGYNFAFIANSREALSQSQKGTYGKHAVMFQNSGLRVFHYGDTENQVIFWGKGIDPNKITLLINDGTQWSAFYHNVKPIITGNFRSVVKWVMDNNT